MKIIVSCSPSVKSGSEWATFQRQAAVHSPWGVCIHAGPDWLLMMTVMLVPYWLYIKTHGYPATFLQLCLKWNYSTPFGKSFCFREKKSRLQLIQDVFRCNFTPENILNQLQSTLFFQLRIESFETKSVVESGI